MRDLKYIKLFEAFDSIKLGKTMNFLNSKSKNDFLRELNMISKLLDFPISNFTDEMFEYLPFKSALRVKLEPNIVEREVCNYESEWISGEFCSGGQVKRTWGKGIRIITCPKCKGTGLKPERKKEGEIGIIKFWFDKDGNYVKTTGCDGEIRPQSEKFSKNINDYEILQDISHAETINLPHLTPILFSRYNRDPDTISIVYKEHGNTYIIQDSISGSAPRANDWQKFGSSSWNINSRRDFTSAKLLKLKESSNKVDENPYDWNNLLDWGRFRLSNSLVVKDELKSAHFALILDMNKLKSLEYKKLSKTKSDRKSSRIGLEELKPENVKKANIERYLTTLVSRFDTSKGLEEVHRIFPRALGFNNCFTFLLEGVNIGNLENLVSHIYSIMLDPSNGYYQERAKRVVSDIYTSSERRGLVVNNNIDKVWKKIDSYDNVKNKEKASKYFEEYLEIGPLLNNLIKSTKIETISDYEFMISRLKGIRELSSNSRIRSIQHLRSIAEGLSNEGYSSQAFDYILYSIDNNENALEELQKFKKNIRL